MLLVESNKPCDSQDGRFELWAHMRTRATVKLRRLLFPPLKPNALRYELGLPDVAEPQAIIDLAKCVDGQAELFNEIEWPATTTVLWCCNAHSHADGTERHFADFGRAEVASRIIWTPKHMEGDIATVDPDLLSRNDSNVWWATQLNNGEVHPIVSVPLTWDENLWALARPTAELVPALPYFSPVTAIRAVLHRDALGEPIERLHQVDVSHRIPAPPMIVGPRRPHLGG